MIVCWKHVTRRVVSGLSLALLVMVCVACAGFGGLGGATPTATPTAAPAAAGQTYNGAGFTLMYPQGWTEQSVAGGVAFTDANNINVLTVASLPNPEGTRSASSVADATFPTIENATLKNPQPLSLSATATVAGEAWVQRGATGTVTSGGLTVPGELILLADNHPANAVTTQAYEIYYGGPQATFSLVTTVSFQPILQSFKFTS